MGNNQVGYCGNQCNLSNSTLGNAASITIVNSGICSGSMTNGSDVGYVNGNQIVPNPFSAGDSFTLIVSNSGNDSSAGGGENNVGYVNGSQVGVGPFSVGSDAFIHITNSGTNTTMASGGATGYVHAREFEVDGPFSAENNLVLIVDNSATNPHSSAMVGWINSDQIYFQASSTLKDGTAITASNRGTGTVQGDQIAFAQGCSVTGKATMTAINEETATLVGYGIHFSGDTGAGGDIDIVLQNSSLLVDATISPFTIGALNGDIPSTAQFTNDELDIILDAGVTANFAGNILTGGANLVINGSGTQILSGTNSYNGTVTVNGGTLNLASTGSLVCPVNVNSPGTLAGNGTVTNLVTNAGTVSPGNSNSIGVLTFNSFMNTSTGIYAVTVNGAPQSDLINVTDTATLDGGTVVVGTSDGTYSFQTPYTILTAGTRVGMFSNAVAISPVITPVLTYDDPAHVFLTLFGNFSNAATTHNQANVANGLDSIVNPTALQNTLMSEIANLSLSEATSALDSLSGWQYTTSLWVAQTINEEFIKRLYDAARFLITPTANCTPCYGQTSGDTGNLSLQPETKCQECNRWDIWMEGGGTFKNLYGNENAHGLRANGGEVTIGIQKRFNCLTVGVAGSYEHDSIHYKKSGGSGNSNTWLAALYGIYSPKYCYFLADLAYGHSSNQMHRSMHAGPLKFHAHSKPKISELTFYGEFGGGLRGSIFSFEPFLGLFVGENWSKHLKESGGEGWAMKIHKKDCNLVKSRLGVHFTAQPGAAYIAADIAWDKRFSGAHSSIGGEFIEFGDDFVIEGLGVDSNSFDYALTIGRAKNCWKVYVQAAGEYWNKANYVDILAGFQYSW
jgi:autotransporter-associated beta strand protein